MQNIFSYILTLLTFLMNFLFQLKQEKDGLPHTRLDNFPNSAAASLAFFAANSLFSTSYSLH